MLDVTTVHTGNMRHVAAIGSRGSNRDNLMIRLAGEGVPVAALARAFQIGQREVSVVLKEAVGAGTLGALPPKDWEGGVATGKRTLTETVDLEAVERDAQQIRLALRLTRNEARMLALLVARRNCTTAALHIAISGQHSKMQIVKVTMCNLREKLKADERTASIEIVTLFGYGYRLGDAGRRALRDLIGEGDHGSGTATS